RNWKWVFLRRLGHRLPHEGLQHAMIKLPEIGRRHVLIGARTKLKSMAGKMLKRAGGESLQLADRRLERTAEKRLRDAIVQLRNVAVVQRRPREMSQLLDLLIVNPFFSKPLVKRGP